MIDYLLFFNLCHMIRVILTFRFSFGSIDGRSYPLRSPLFNLLEVAFSSHKQIPDMFSQPY